MSAGTRLHEEKIFHDRQAQARAPDLATRGLIFADKDYLDHESWIRPAFEKLGEVRGRDVLDLGCGHGMAAIVLARRGARVTALDLSAGYVAEASARSAANDVGVRWLAAEGERLPFADESFDAIWGSAILHHLDVDRAGRELARVLRPGGRAVFCEPWGENPLLEWARRHLPYPEKHRTADEQPLDGERCANFRKHFDKFALEGHQLLSMIGRIGRRTKSFRKLSRWDRRLIDMFPGLQRWCRYVILTMESPKKLKL